jgi:3-hydroxy-9,10-secoandrosta-1,3,5(10)-triene-9,17-dione monooxygenase
MGAPGIKRLEDPESQRFFGKAMMLTESAEALNLAATERYMEQCRRWARDGTPITASDTMAIWGMCREACLMACEAVELLFQTAGAFVTRRNNRLQRYFRDVQMYRIHVTAQPRVEALRAQAHFGLDPVFSGPRRQK